MKTSCPARQPGSSSQTSPTTARSAAGIFQSNLTDDGSRDDEQLGTYYDIDRLSEVLGTRIFDPNELYATQQNASLEAAGHRLGITITDLPS
jgi:uncharacterized glyoxalase superfamily metalloenzyme YdcJ